MSKDPRKSRRAKAPLAPGARRLEATSDAESLPSAPSLGCPSLSPERGVSKRRKSSEPRRVVVAEPRKPILRRGDDRTRLVLRGRAEVEGTKDSKVADEAPHVETKRKKEPKGEKRSKAEKKQSRNSLEEPAPAPRKTESKPPKASDGKKVAKSGAGPKEPEKGNEEKKKKKKEKKEKKHKEKAEDQRKPSEPEPEQPSEPSDAEVRAASPLSPPPVKQKSKSKKEKKAEKIQKSEKEKKKAAKQQEAQKLAEKKGRDTKREAPVRRKEKKSKEVQESNRSESSEDPPPARQTAESPEASRRSTKTREKPVRPTPEVPVLETTELRDRRRRKERSRSDSGSRHRRRRQRILPPDAWQVWPAGSYHPWSSQLAGAPFGMWPGLPGAEMGQTWLGNMPSHVGPVEPEDSADSAGSDATASDAAGPRRNDAADSEESEEELEGRELQAPEEADDDEEEEEEPKAPVVVKTIAAPKPNVATPKPQVTQIAQIAVEDDGSATSQTSEGEESETESQDEDAEIGEAPVARRLIEPLQGHQEDDIPKVKWYPPGPPRTREALHLSIQRWPGPRVGWMPLYPLEIDPAVQMKASVQQIREGEGQGVVNPEGEIQANCAADPRSAPVSSASGPVLPLLIPRWGRSVSRWTSPSQVEVDDAFRWEKRRLSSAVLRSRRNGRSANGGSGGLGADPQDPPETETVSAEGSFLIFLGAVARSVRLVEWRPPPMLVLPEDLKVDPSKYRGLERNLRQKRRPVGPGPSAPGGPSAGVKAAAKSTVAKKKAAVKSSPGVPPPKVQAQVDSNGEYNAKLRAMMQQLQDGSAETDAVASFWKGLSPANRVRFSTEFPQFMHLVGEVQSKAVPAHMLSAVNFMHLPVPPPPKTPPAPGVGVAVPTAMGVAMPGLLATAVPPAGAFAKAASKLTPEVIKQQEALWADRLTFHDGILRADMSSLQLGDAGLARWCQWAPSLLNTLGSVSGAPLSNADLNFSGNAIEDAGLRPLLELLRRCDVHVKSLNLDANRLTEASLVTISDLIAESRDAVSAVHMKNNRVQGSYGLMHLARAIKSNEKYPMFLPEKNRYTPLMLYLAGNMIEKPMQVTQLVKDALDKKFPSLSEERQVWESKHQCPPLQLPCFDKQETSVFQ